VEFDGKDLSRCAPTRLLRMAVAQVPEGAGSSAIFTVKENLKLATWQRRDKAQVPQDMEAVFEVFPACATREAAGLNSVGG